MEKNSILVIDADITTRTQIEVVLSDKYEIITASCGREGLAILKDIQFDTILLDINLPGGISGIEVLFEIKQMPNYKIVPVIMLTSEDTISNQVLSLNNKAFDYIVKPFDSTVLLSRVKKAISARLISKNLEKKINEKDIELDDSYKKIYLLTLQLVSALSKAVEAKDKYTRGHSERVAKYSCMIGKRLNLSKNDLEELNYSAILHDIGKIGVSEEIINKPSKLTAKEQKKMQEHTIIGYNILKKVSEIPKISVGAKWHHERFDGKGYPDGLSGLQIPLIARIISVADAYDAMSSYRPYREPLSQQEIISEIKKGKELQFDPQIADIMISIIKEDKEYKFREIQE